MCVNFQGLTISYFPGWCRGPEPTLTRQMPTSAFNQESKTKWKCFKWWLSMTKKTLVLQCSNSLQNSHWCLKWISFDSFFLTFSPVWGLLNSFARWHIQIFEYFFDSNTEIHDYHCQTCECGDLQTHWKHQGHEELTKQYHQEGPALEICYYFHKPKIFSWVWKKTVNKAKITVLIKTIYIYLFLSPF